MAGTKLQEGQSGPPTLQSTHSYWHKNPSTVLQGHRTTSKLPPAADVVVIGTGITGAFAARELMTGGRSVLHLEAREACWGATGRNGGHCQPMVYSSKPSVARFELGTYHFLKAFVAKNNISCDWHTVGGVHALFDDKAFGLVEKVIQRLKLEHPDLAQHAILVKGEKERGVLRIPAAVGAVYQPNAAKLWPYKLVAWVLEKLLQEYPASRYNLQTNTAVEHLQHTGDGGWVVHTPRGQVVAKHVLLASNAYTSYLLPQFTGIITPVRGQVAGLTPPTGDIPLEHTHVWVQGNGTDDYLIQRDDDGFLILGGERFSTAGAEEGIWDDGQVNDEIGAKLRSQLQHSVKLRGPDCAEEEELDAQYEWTGIMGYAKDHYPWVGRVPPSLGGTRDDGDDDDEDEEGARSHLWISAGYTGHGMPTAARCGIRVAEMILGREPTFDMPVEFLASEERARRTKDAKTTIRRSLMDELNALLDD
ncbi:uncharacterized protein UV8b_00130 [Ustilaginoidea virens]|uniref:FAD dependent oxidoreductase domain-containing protein n=1 Tax=Ustilaginoidea virens TaxID=1159556 RepID=A0A063BN34_USTVR|nr:uncharacterized protein UV8b_00130 [Ustilaginoidea virens]QUC15889.1 hypothetical protein UV8b_00130 [Ustilaginoidea virens]GAO19460.1 hypothetical protein UVI_02064150 [Ustilaginoidea virens]